MEDEKKQPLTTPEEILEYANGLAKKYDVSVHDAILAIEKAEQAKSNILMREGVQMFIATFQQQQQAQAEHKEDFEMQKPKRGSRKSTTTKKTE
jgi:hypothetical protein